MKKNKNLIILIILFIIIDLLFVYENFIRIEGKITFELNGNEEINIYQDTPYNDDGYLLENDFNKDLNKYVKTENNVDTKNIGTYEVIYNLKYKTKKLTLTRKVNVIHDELNDYQFNLNGEQEVYILLNSTYTDPGYTCTNNGENIEVKLEMKTDLDLTKVGDYKLEYTLRKQKLERTIHVYDYEIKYELTPKEDYKEVVFNYDTNIVKEIMIDNSIIKIDDTKYDLQINGDYKFIITDIHNNTKEINIKIEDIKRTYTCSGTVDRKGTNLEIQGMPNINTAIAWKINNKAYTGNTSKVYLKYKKANTAEATITYANNTSDKVTCTIKNKLLYQFDIQSRSNPLTCGKVNTGLNNLLAQVVQEAGKGTRSGVVEAGRFLQSAVPYIIPYQGRSANNIYKFHGLSSEWGCRASNGYINGLDCVGLFWWPFYQNDNRGDGAGACSNNAVPLKENLDKIRVGDWIVSYDADIQKSMGCAYSHGSIIIGIDDKYIYTLSNNVEIFNKKNLPGHNQTNGDVYLAHYGNDGDYTDMWVTDY